jgi:hypothetical protein
MFSEAKLTQTINGKRVIIDQPKRMTESVWLRTKNKRRPMQKVIRHLGWIDMLRDKEIIATEQAYYMNQATWNALNETLVQQSSC